MVRAKSCCSSGYSLAGQPVFTSKTWPMWNVFPEILFFYLGAVGRWARMKWGSFLTSKCSRMGGGMFRASLVLALRWGLGLPLPVAKAEP